ncbi:GNAT family N-acetyltransferase [Streptomyces lavendulae]|uniref:GNAT family N-acetyltransferase n=1 Tax=Streptomyces lavendulae TaxID=1914 RepID=UPI0024A42B55|nr:GNAT family protein [Streptomyces lavendulae]GLX20776.1 N-acetyltransferase [Streptomyces lavendulae subsp. lavendulae]GLX28062.1 N-acetyltransferase [Streptomyces lavendulae subsp. lavendulae]
MTPVHLAGPRLALREVEPEDTADLLAIYGDPEATRHLSFEPRTPDQVQAIVDRSIASAKDTPRTEYCLAITPAGEHRLIGYARLATEPQQAATIGFALNPGEWGKGLGTETVHMLCALGFKVLGLHRIWAARSPLNEASARTLLRAGMTEDGRIRDHVFVHGAWRDSITYSILEHEWVQTGTFDLSADDGAPAGMPLSAADSGQDG